MRNSQIRILCATRQRAKRCEEMLVSFLETRGSCETQIFCYVDKEDPQVADYYNLFQKLEIEHTFGKRMTMPDVINTGIWAFEDADAYGEVNDDHIYRTHEWDLKLFAAIQKHDGLGMAYGRTQNLPSATMASARCVHKLGWYFPPSMKHQFVDNALVDLYGALGWLHHVPEVWIEHCHPDFGKANHDETYGVMRSHWDHDRAAYEEWRRSDLPADLDRLRSLKLQCSGGERKEG